jgi:hypothetical protein
VRNAQTSAAQVVQHHYRKRMTSSQSWQRLFTGKTNVWRSLQNFGGALRTLIRPEASPGTYLDQISALLASPPCPCLVVIGEDDVGGQEFRLYANKLNLLEGKITQALIRGGNHSFSTKAQRDMLLFAVLTWLRQNE